MSQCVWEGVSAAVDFAARVIVCEEVFVSAQVMLVGGSCSTSSWRLWGGSTSRVGRVLQASSCRRTAQTRKRVGSDVAGCGREAAGRREQASSKVMFLAAYHYFKIFYSWVALFEVAKENDGDHAMTFTGVFFFFGRVLREISF